ncbi:hypothetical protein ACG2F4_03210 [Halalkalibaculum sp. DA3122]
MQYTRSNSRLTVQLESDFNLNAVREIKTLWDGRKELHVDLQQARFVNTEAVIFIHKLLQGRTRVRLKNPPKIFFEVLHILGLHEIWDLENIIQR